jgi:putative CocE/NonD family hydrolase
MSTTMVNGRVRQALTDRFGPLGSFEVEVNESLTVLTDDGVELGTTLARPQVPGTVPAVLVRTPYGRSPFVADATGFMPDAIVWASHGYACVLQETRTTTSYFAEAADGAATVKWIEAQPWFDGRLGLAGYSYLAYTALATASTRPDCLKAIATSVYSADRVSSWYPGGTFDLQLAMIWATLQQTGDRTAPEDPVMHLPLGDADVAATGRTLDFFQERLAYDADDPHWKPLDMTEVLDDPPAPILHVGGWYDFHRVPSFEDFERLSSSTVPYRFVLGPWTHGGVDDRLHMEEKLAWFDTHVRGNQTRQRAPLRYYRSGDRAGWAELDSWQEPTTIAFYAGSDNQLSAEPASETSRVEWTYDPAEPTPSVMLTLGFDETDVSGPFDDSVLEDRPDVRCFTTDILTQPIDCLGRVTAQTTLFSDAPSADIFIRVMDVLEAGETVNLAQGILRITDARLAEAGVPVNIDVGPVAHRFASGHRIRLLISSAAHPFFNRNLGTGESPRTATTILVAHQGVSIGGPSGLRVDLPLARHAENLHTLRN